MDEKIIIGYDERQESRDAVVLGRRLAELTGARIVLATVRPPGDSSLSGFEPASDREEDAGRIFAPALAELGDLAVETRTCEGAPVGSLHDLAEAEGARMIIVGSAQRGHLGRAFIGSVAEGLLCCSRCAVAVAPRGLASRGAGNARAIGVAFDNSPESRVALRQAAELARGTTVTLRVIGVIEPVAPHRHLMEAWLEQAIDSLPEGLDVEGRLRFGSVVEQLEAETEKLDLIVLGSRGYGLMRRILLGYVSGRLLHSSSCPVVVVPGAAASPDEASSGTACLPQPQPALRG